MKEKYGDVAQILKTLTKCFCSVIKPNGKHEDKKNEEMFVTFNYPEYHSIYSEVNKEIKEKFKANCGRKNTTV